MIKRPVLFYGWVIVGVAFVGMILIYGIRNTFPVFFPPILKEFGWYRGSTALMLSLNLLIYGAVAPVAGSLGDRWKPKRVMTIGIIILGLATAGCAFARELWHFYLLFGVLAPIGSALSGWALLAPALANWFAKRRGLVIGLAQTGGGLSFAYAMVTEFAISHLGWRYAYFILAGILVAILLPLYLFLFHYRPENKGLTAYGIAEVTVTKDLTAGLRVKEPVSPSWTLGHAMRTYQLWLLVLSNFFSWGIGGYLVLSHQVKFVEDAGYSSMFAASVFALFGILAAVGNLSSSISDWIGRGKTITVATILAIVAIAALISVKDTSQTWLLYVYAICFGYGLGLYTPTLFASTADMFYGRHFGAIIGLVLTGVGIGGVIGPWLGGYIYDISGSYTGAFILCMACLALSCISFWIAAPRHAAKAQAKIQR